MAAIEDTFHGDIAVAGIVEIGSFAKGEAIPISDTDTRVYIRGSDILYANFVQDGDHPAEFQEFLAKDRGMEQRFLSYPSFNTEVRERLIGKVDNKISCGFIDIAHAEFLFDNLNLYPTQDHSMLFQSTIVHDPEGWISRRRAELDGKVYNSLIEMYRNQVLNRAQKQLPLVCQ